MVTATDLEIPILEEQPGATEPGPASQNRRGYSLSSGVPACCLRVAPHSGGSRRHPLGPCTQATGCLWPRLPFPPCSSCLAMKPIQERKAWVCDPIVVETTVPKALSSSGGEMIPDSCSFLFLTDLRRRLEPGTGSRVARVPAPALPCARWVTVVRFPSALFCASISPVCENRYENSTLPPGVLRGCKDWFVHSPQDSASFLEEGQYHPHNYCWSAAAVAVCSVGYLYEV